MNDTRHRFVTLAIFFAASLCAAAGCGSSSHGGGGSTNPTNAEVAFVDLTSERPALLIQDGAGNGRRQIHFTGAADSISINSPDFPVTDESILEIGPLAWSPDGTRLALELTVASDQSEIVVVDADGMNATVASINTQQILTPVDWSADGARLAYGMSTTAGANGIDLFVTDLATSQVERVTDGADLAATGVRPRFSADGQSLLFSDLEDQQSQPVFNRVTSVSRIDLTSKAISPVASGLVGDVQGIARSGERALLATNVASDPGSESRTSLVWRDLTGAAGARSPELANGHVIYASVIQGDRRVFVVTDLSADPSVSLIAYLTTPVDGGGGEVVGGLPTDASVAADVFE